MYLVTIAPEMPNEKPMRVVCDDIDFKNFISNIDKPNFLVERVISYDQYCSALDAKVNSVR